MAEDAALTEQFRLGQIDGGSMACLAFMVTECQDEDLIGLYVVSGFRNGYLMYTECINGTGILYWYTIPLSSDRCRLYSPYMLIASAIREEDGILHRK